jgi:putative ABC transport system ATP-binding protein
MDAAATQLAIHARGVAKAFGKGDSRVVALQSADFDVPCGEMAMLVGPSGCGKTTFISIIAGLLARDQGELSVLGTDPSALGGDRRTAWRLKTVGFVFQQFNLIPQLSVVENVAVPLVLGGVRMRDAIELSSQMMARVGLKGRERGSPIKLSGGQQQRVAIARALVNSPRILVCDEPTSALDGATGQSVMELIAQTCRGPDRAVVIVTHDERIFRFADRIAHMDDGRVDRLTDRDGHPIDGAAAHRRAAMENHS